jgi:hypothetical protein
MQHDPAFMWETEAMRETSDRRAPTRAASHDAAQGWVTLRDASRLTGIPLETIRKWARRETIPSYIEETANLRMVSLEGVLTRASDLGREVQPDQEPAAPPPPPAPSPVPPPVPEPDATHGPTGAPETMIVPVAAWDKMLMQLGNLHEAGQQLAEARERGAKAETEARFLRERLAEMRAEREGPAPVDAAPRGEAPLETQQAQQADAQPLWRYVYRGWRARRRGRRP